MKAVLSAYDRVYCKFCIFMFAVSLVLDMEDR